jgi:Protein of unknown function (DUF3293)
MIPALEAAYHRTTYRVLAPDGAIDLHIGRRSSALDALLAQRGVQSWAFLSACNPRSVCAPPEVNRQRTVRLERLLAARGWPWLDGAGIPRDRRRAPEPSVWIGGISLRDARRVATQFGQNALLVGRHGRPARLVWLR